MSEGAEQAPYGTSETFSNRLWPAPSHHLCPWDAPHPSGWSLLYPGWLYDQLQKGSGDTSRCLEENLPVPLIFPS